VGCAHWGSDYGNSRCCSIDYDAVRGDGKIAVLAPRYRFATQRRRWWLCGKCNLRHRQSDITLPRRVPAGSETLELGREAPGHAYLSAAGPNADCLPEFHLEADFGYRGSVVAAPFFHFSPGTMKSEQVVKFLSNPHRQIGKTLLIVSDEVGTRKGRVWSEERNEHVDVALFSPYAPELNPLEAIWAYLTKNQIANVYPTTISETCKFARRRPRSIQHRPKFIRAFWRQAELALLNVTHLSKCHRTIVSEQANL
jgi:transposase